MLTVAFLLLGEVLIFIPSIARFRLTYLEERVAAAHLATLSLDVRPGVPIDPVLEQELLRHAGVLAVTLWRPGAELMLGRPVSVDRVFDLRRSSAFSLIVDAVDSMRRGEDRMSRIIGSSDMEPNTIVDVILDETPLRSAMFDYAGRILTLTLVLSAIVGLLLFLSLRGMIIRPLEEITERLAAFRRTPEDPSLDRHDIARADEIGVVEAELAAMQRRLRQALVEKTRLAVLGAAVSRISHDLRSILASAVLISDRLESSSDPAVRRAAPRLVQSLDRAIRLCADTLDFAREKPQPPRLTTFDLKELVAEVAEDGIRDAPRFRVAIGVPEAMRITADRDQLYRVFLNLLRNARQAVAGEAGELRVCALKGQGVIRVTVADSGPGIPVNVLPHLFESFSGSGKSEGNGLGLAICREIMRAHGGDISLLASGPSGTAFELVLPEGREVAPMVVMEERV
jgi:signal transduction histidine kinase